MIACHECLHMHQTHNLSTLHHHGKHCRHVDSRIESDCNATSDFGGVKPIQQMKHQRTPKCVRHCHCVTAVVCTPMLDLPFIPHCARRHDRQSIEQDVSATDPQLTPCASFHGQGPVPEMCVSCLSFSVQAPGTTSTHHLSSKSCSWSSPECQCLQPC